MLGLVYGAACQAWFNHVLLAPTAFFPLCPFERPIDRRGRLDSNTQKYADGSLRALDEDPSFRFV